MNFSPQCPRDRRPRRRRLRWRQTTAASRPCRPPPVATTPRTHLDRASAAASQARPWPAAPPSRTRRSSRPPARSPSTAWCRRSSTTRRCASRRACPPAAGTARSPSWAAAASTATCRSRPTLQFSESILTERYATMGTNGGYDAPARAARLLQGGVRLRPRAAGRLHLPIRAPRAAAGQGADPAASTAAPARAQLLRGLLDGRPRRDDRGPALSRRTSTASWRARPAGNIMGLFMQFNRIAKQVRNPGEHAQRGQADAAGQRGAGAVRRARRRGRRHHLQARRPATTTRRRCAAPAARTPATAACRTRRSPRCNTVTSPIASADGAVGAPGLLTPAPRTPPRAGASTSGPTRLSAATRCRACSRTASCAPSSRATRPSTRRPGTSDDWLPRMERGRQHVQRLQPRPRGHARRGAKLIMWNGTTDTSVSPRDNARYYERVVAHAWARPRPTRRRGALPGAGRGPLLRRRRARQGRPAEGHGDLGRERHARRRRRTWCIASSMPPARPR